MRTVAFKMQLLPGNTEEYIKRHDEIWPELSEVIRKAGISDYSIFLDEQTLTLFAIQTQTSDSRAHELPDHPVVKKWWKHMAPLMETHPDNSPVSKDLKQIFHLE